jgi:uncharacterized protein
MDLIIDGYNLLYAGLLPSRTTPFELEQARDRLVALLSAYKDRKPGKITVVFDGWQAGWSSEQRELKKGTEVIFSRMGERADEVIKRMVQEKGSGVFVVSSDREIANYADRRGIAVISSEQFLERLEALAIRSGEDQKPDERDERPSKQKGPSRTLSKKEKRLRSALKKI